VADEPRKFSDLSDALYEAHPESEANVAIKAAMLRVAAYMTANGANVLRLDGGELRLGVAESVLTMWRSPDEVSLHERARLYDKRVDLFTLTDVEAPT